MKQLTILFLLFGLTGFAQTSLPNSGAISMNDIKTVMFNLGEKTITWQTDIAPGSTLAYATKHSNLGFTCTGFYEDVLDASVIERSYNPNIIITRSGANIITVEFTDVFVGYIVIS